MILAVPVDDIQDGDDPAVTGRTLPTASDKRRLQEVVNYRFSITGKRGLIMKHLLSSLFVLVAVVAAPYYWGGATPNYYGLRGHYDSGNYGLKGHYDSGNYGLNGPYDSGSYNYGN